MCTEQTLLDQLRHGSEQAFRTLVDTWYPKVLNLCMHYLNDAEEAEDIAQDVFVEVFESVNRFRGDAAVSTWIFRIAVNKSLNRRKRLQRSRLLFPFSMRLYKPATHLPVPEQEDHTFKTPDVSLEQQDDRRALHQALMKLPAQQQTAFLLSKTELKSYQEIASIMELSVSAVESLIFRAKANLRKHLANYIKQKE